jgi:hypothetical protein
MSNRVVGGAQIGSRVNPNSQFPGTIQKSEADAANNLAELFNAMSTKFPKNENDNILTDLNPAALMSAPGSLVGRGVNKVKREEPFRDDIKVAAGPIDDLVPGNKFPSYNVLKDISPQVDNLLSLVDAPRLGDYAADSAPNDTRQYGAPPFPKKKDPLNNKPKPFSEYSVDTGRVGPTNDISRVYQVSSGGQLKVGYPATEDALPVHDNEWNAPSEANEISSSAVVNTNSHVPVAKRLFKNKNFLSRFLMGRYGY